MLDTILISANIFITIVAQIQKSRCTRIKSNCGCFDIDLTRNVPIEEVDSRVVK